MTYATPLLLDASFGQDQAQHLMGNFADFEVIDDASFSEEQAQNLTRNSVDLKDTDDVPEQRDVFYTVISEDGKTREYMIVLPSANDLETVKSAVEDQIASNPDIKGQNKVHIQNTDGIIGG